MGLKMKKLTIVRVHQFLGEGGQKKKTIYRGVCPERRTLTVCRGRGKKERGGFF